MKVNNTDLHQELEAENSKRRSLIGNFPSNAVTFLPAKLELSVQCQSVCYQHITILLTFLLPRTRAVLPEGATLWVSTGPGLSCPGGDHSCTFWSLEGPGGSHLPEELLDSLGIWNNSTSKSTKTNKVSELRCTVT